MDLATQQNATFVEEAFRITHKVNAQGLELLQTVPLFQLSPAGHRSQ